MNLGREELYELVWSEPMVRLAKRFALTDVALAKTCKRMGIPVPAGLLAAEGDGVPGWSTRSAIPEARDDQAG